SRASTPVVASRGALETGGVYTTSKYRSPRGVHDVRVVQAAGAERVCANADREGAKNDPCGRTETRPVRRIGTLRRPRPRLPGLPWSPGGGGTRCSAPQHRRRGRDSAWVRSDVAL